MREYELIIDEALKIGLSPEYAVPFNTQVLYDCLGFRCGKVSLEPYIELTNPLPNTVDMYYDWPFPQFLNHEKYNILVVRDTFNQVDEVYQISSDHSTVTNIFSIDELTFGKGTLMEMADFGKYMLMTNGIIMIYRDTDLSLWSHITTSATIPMMRTICNFKGQAVGGNIVGSWHDCDETFYVWSKIGEMDFTPDIKNTAGYRRDPYGGEVYHVRRLGDNIVGYSSKGITLLSPVSAPVTTFKFTEVSEIGLINRGAIGGNLRRHIYVSEFYNLMEVTDKGIKELGYRQYMEELTDGDVIVNYEPALDNFYISDSTKTFLLSPNGLTEIPQHPSAVWRLNNNSYMLPDTVDTYEPLIITEVFDMGYKGQKTIFTIESDVFLSTDPQASVDLSTNLSSWKDVNYKPINNQGIATIIISGNFFRFKLKFESVPSGFKIGYIKARYKMTDLRGIRGVYAPPLRGQ